MQMFRDELSEPSIRFEETNYLKNQLRHHRAAFKSLCDGEVAHQVRCAINRLQRIKASGVYQEWCCRSLWDEMCVEEFIGPGEFRPFMEPDVAKIVNTLVSRIPRHLVEAMHCWLDDEGPVETGSMNLMLITDAIDQELWNRALLRGERMHEIRLL
ncbi:hypothetical protein [Novosphingopyxis baekryungensis]|uniref:hypothetical protein n=1 Tax=Novosphingopyxis baekryungensis TaxID=279369 RepID=UPI0003B589FB|nr:hypothetical protein [Novosphingopyxis baekryungensis]